MLADADVAPEEMVPLDPIVLHILSALANRGLSGREVIEQVSADTRGKIEMDLETLRDSIAQMRGAGLIEESEERAVPSPDDERGHYYRLTEFGCRVLTAEMSRLEGALLKAICQWC